MNKVRTGCLAEYLRAMPRGQLSKYEQQMLDADIKWREANLDDAVMLEALVGRHVVAREDRVSMDGRTRFERGERYSVAARWLDRLLIFCVRGNEQTYLSVREDWVKVAARRT